MVNKKRNIGTRERDIIQITRYAAFNVPSKTDECGRGAVPTARNPIEDCYPINRRLLAWLK